MSQHVVRIVHSMKYRLMFSPLRNLKSPASSAKRYMQGISIYPSGKSGQCHDCRLTPGGLPWAPTGGFGLPAFCYSLSAEGWGSNENIQTISRRLPSLIIVAAAFALTGCSDSKESEDKEYWLEQHSTFRNEWDRVARVFGFSDDYEGCEMIVKALSVTQPKARYRCDAVN